MAVRKLKSGKWQADVTVGRRWDGRPDRRTECCDTRAKALKAERRLLLEKERRSGFVSARMTLSEFVDEVYWPQKQGLRRNSRDTYRQVLARVVLPRLGDSDIEAINKMAVQRMLLGCPTRKSAQTAREVLSSVMRVAVEMGMLRVNPASFRYQYPKAGDGGHQGEWLTTFPEHARLLRHLAERHPGEPEERMVLLGLCFGLRKGEILGLDWESVDIPGRTIRIDQTYTVGCGEARLDDPKTPRSFRTIPMTEYAASRMAAWGPGEGPVVTGPGGGRMNPHTAGNRMRVLVREEYADGAPLPRVTLYTLRHSFATACIGAGIEVSRVSAWLGHVDFSTTYNRYVRPLLSDLADSAAEIDAAYGMRKNANDSDESAGR